MYTMRFEAGRMRPDFARFATVKEWRDAATYMIHRRYHGMPLRIRVRNAGGQDVYYFTRP